MKDITTKIRSGATPSGGESAYLPQRQRYALIRSQNVFDRYFDETRLAFISDEQASSLSGAEVMPGDLLLNITGDGITFARSCLVPATVLPACVNQHVMIIRVDAQRCEPGYLLSYLTHPNVKPYIESFNAGGSRRAITKGHIESFEVPLPPLPTQHRIADILSALDDKIELNRQINATLEAMAQAVFKEWFVQNESIDDWEIVPLPEIMDINPNCSLRKDKIAPYLDMANVPTQGHRAIEWRERAFSSGTKFVNGDTLLARITPCLENGKTAFVDFLDDGEIGWGSTEFIVLRPKPPLPPEYGYYLARSNDLRTHAIQNMVGSSGRQRVPSSCFDNFLLPVPPSELARRFGAIAKSIMAKIAARDNESRLLGQIRDALLPKLMCGEIAV